MAKTNILEWDATANNNTDINSIGVLGTNAVNNFDNAFRELMAQGASNLVSRFTSRAVGYTAVKADYNQVSIFTASATLSLTAAATLTNGWSYIVVASGGDVTVDPNGAETINGAATLLVQDGSAVEIMCNGTAFFTTDWRKTPTVQTFTANGTWTKPAGCKYVVVEAVGGGGGGGSCGAGGGGLAAAAAGGNAGFYGFTSPVSVSAIASGAVTIGALGAAGTGGASGSQGGNTSIVLGATTYTWGGAPGGVGSAPNAGARIPQLGGSPTGTNVLGSGNRGSANGFSDGASTFGQGGYGADSPFGTGGAGGRAVTAGTAQSGGSAGASNYGAGGGGAAAVSNGGTVSGGDEAPGFVRVWEYY